MSRKEIFFSRRQMTDSSWVTQLPLLQLKQSLLNRLNFNHPLAEAIVGLLFVSSQNEVSLLCNSAFRIIRNAPVNLVKLARWIFYLFITKKAPLITKVATVSYITDDNKINDLYEKVRWNINNMTSVEEQGEICYVESSTRQTMKQIPSNKNSFVLFQNKKILYSSHSPKITIHGDREYTRLNHVLTIAVDNVDSRDDTLDHFIEFCKKSYEKHIATSSWKQKVFTHNDKAQWTSVETNYQRDVKTVVFRENLADTILNDLSDFYTSESWYTERGVPYTRGYAFFGPPGTGKTSYIRALASHFKKNLYYIDLSSIADNVQLSTLLNDIKCSESFIIIEDIDRSSSVVLTGIEEKKLEIKKFLTKSEPTISDMNCVLSLIDEVDYSAEVMTIAKTDILEIICELDKGSDVKKLITLLLATLSPKDVKTKEPLPESKLTMNSVLAMFDGSGYSANGRVLFITANRPELIPPVVVRRGRIDAVYEINLCDFDQLRRLFKAFYGIDAPTEMKNFKPLPPCNATSSFIAYKTNPALAWAEIENSFCTKMAN